MLLVSMARITFKLSTMIEENIESYLHQTEELLLNYPPWLEKILYVTCFKWLEFTLNCPPWLAKNLKVICLK